MSLSLPPFWSWENWSGSSQLLFTKEGIRECLKIKLVVYFINTKAHGIGMTFELLILCHCNNGMPYAADTIIGKMLESNLTIIAIKVHTIVCQGIAMSGKSMVRTAGIVASTLTGILSEEDATGVDNLLCQLLIIICSQDEVFRRIAVAKLYSLIGVMNQDKIRILQRLCSNLFSWQALQLNLYLIGDSIQRFL